MSDFEKGLCKKLSELEDIKCVVVDKKGFCCSGHHVGQEFIIKRLKTCEGICVSAFHSMLTQYFGFVFGATFPWDTDKNYTYCGCPDPVNTVTFRLEKVKKEKKDETDNKK